MTETEIVAIVTRRANDRRQHFAEAFTSGTLVDRRRRVRRSVNTDSRSDRELELHPELKATYTFRLVTRNERFHDLVQTTYYLSEAGREAGARMQAEIGWHEVQA